MSTNNSLRGDLVHFLHFGCTSILLNKSLIRQPATCPMVIYMYQTRYCDITFAFLHQLFSCRSLFRGHSTTNPSAHQSRRPGPSGQFCLQRRPALASARPSPGTSRAPRAAAPSRGCDAPRSRGPPRCHCRHSPFGVENIFIKAERYFVKLLLHSVFPKCFHL